VAHQHVIHVVDGGVPRLQRDGVTLETAERTTTRS
jgi:hypothetical protein